MEFDVVLLSRLQFAFTIMVHYLFPPLSIGMGVLLVIFEAMWLKTGDPDWHRLTKYWVKLFAVTFAVGVATGIVMEFEFGTNWAVYSRFVGDVFGSALAAEGIFAFFLESGFLAVLVFGWDRVGKKMHFFSTLMVCLGSIFSSVWIVIANSWQQTPAGHHIVAAARGERAEIVDFWAIGLQSIDHGSARPRLDRRTADGHLLRDEHQRLLPLKKPPPRVCEAILYRGADPRHDCGRGCSDVGRFFRTDGRAGATIQACGDGRTF